MVEISEESQHFRWQGAYLIGRTAVGRVTVVPLHINDDYRIELREGLIEEGVFPRHDAGAGKKGTGVLCGKPVVGQ